MMNKEQRNGALYVHARIGCPACAKLGSSTPANTWVHNNCGGPMYLGSNAKWWCKRCSEDSHVTEWKYSCSSPSHPGGPSGAEFVGTDATAFAEVVAVAGSLVQEMGLPWLQELLENLA